MAKPNKREIIKDYILSEIRQNNLKPGDRLYSRTTFMQKFKCAKATVDHVISELIGTGIIYGEYGNGTFVSPPKKNCTGNTVVIIGKNHYMSQNMIKGFIGTFGDKNPIIQYNLSDIKYPEIWEKCKRQKGILFIQPDNEQSSQIFEAQYLNIPHIVLFRDPVESSFISIDNYGAMSAIVDALVLRKCTKIAYAGLHQTRYHFPEQRYAGYLEGLLKNGLSFRKEWCGLRNRQNTDDYLKVLFGGALKPDAVIASEYPIEKIIAAALSAGLKPGIDLYLASLDEVSPGTFPFKVIAQRGITYEIGKAAGDAFKRILEDPGHKIQQYIVPDAIEQ